MKSGYNELVIEYFRNPKNVGRIEDADGKATEGSPACGDMVSVYIKVDKESNVIEDIKFESYGCASNIATASIVTELAKGKTIEEAKKISWKDASDALGGLPPIKVHCSVLAVEGLHAAIEDYEEKHGLIKEKAETTADIVKKKLRHIMNPSLGIDIISSDIVKEISVEKGKVEIVISIADNHQFAKNIEDEIKEKMNALWDIEKVSVKFVG